MYLTYRGLHLCISIKIISRSEEAGEKRAAGEKDRKTEEVVESREKEMERARARVCLCVCVSRRIVWRKGQIIDYPKGSVAK